MAVHFHPLTIKKIIRETPDCVSVIFDIPDDLKQEFNFREGQNITVKAVINGNEIRRSYSICTAPHENDLKVAIKAVEGGMFSVFANKELKKGDRLEVLPPTGKFNSRSEAARPGNFLAIAAGSGITPIISIIKHTLRQNDSNKFTLIYGNRSRGSIIFFDELEGLKNKYIDRFNLVNVLSRERTDAEINYGRIDNAKLKDLGNIVNYKSFDSIYICGPEEMIFSAGNYFESLGIDKKKIHFELFTTPGQKLDQGRKEEITTGSSGPSSRVTIKLDGRAIDFDLPFKGQNILDAALAQGADLPYACKGGVCCTCRAKLISGEVKMDVNYALEPEEIEAGFVLTCQSHPLSDQVVIDFDIK